MRLFEAPMVRRLAFVPLLAVAALACATAPQVRPDDWVSHAVCGPDTRPGKGEDYCLEVVEIGERPERPRGAVLLIPGMFQNGQVFDLLPDDGVSFARWMIREVGVAVYLLHVRGIGGSDYPPRSTLDDIAIDDVPRAIAFVAEREATDVVAIGHSQGAMVLQGALSGLTRCSGGPCFDAAVAEARQAPVRSLGLFTGNPALTGLDARFSALTFAGVLVFGPGRYALDRIDVRPFLPIGQRLATPALVDFLYLPGTVAPEVVEALMTQTVEATTSGIVAQLVRGAVDGGLETASGERWADHLVHVAVPVVWTTFDRDPLSMPLQTWRDGYARLGTAQRKFKRVRGQAHESFLLDPDLFGQHRVTLEELVAGW
jgi:pimeloyl-ACP methyl ester carboxylesterase